MLLLAASGVAQTPPFRAVRECAKCHPAEAKQQPSTSMAHALELPSECTILRAHPLLTFAAGAYSYRIERQGDRSMYTVSDGKQSMTAEIQWAVGLGSAGQTYVYSKDGQFYQSRVSFYKAVNGLDLTLGAPNEQPKDLLHAAGQPMDRSEQEACFGCHSTNAVEHHQVHLDRMIPGVQCEHCHGDTQDHLAKLAPMKSLRNMGGEDAANFCGQCHRTWEQIATSGVHGVVDVRFQPYRLTNSKCFDAEDHRIACTACHNPHEEVDTKLADYDGKCMACHATGKKCKIAASNCASCHMRKIEIPGSHNLFTDHQIRIVRASDPYPN